MKNAHSKNKEFYFGKRLLVTGHTGFKGTWLTAILNYLGADTLGYALSPEKDSLYEKIRGDELLKSVIGDVRNYSLLSRTIRDFQPEIVIHLAALAQVKDCFENPMEAYTTNVLGTVNLLEALRYCESIKSIVVVTTDKVYENNGDGAIYKESDILGGSDPYSTSKTCMEYIVKAYQNSYFQAGSKQVGIATVRASNVLGGGDFIQSRLIPSVLNAIAKSEKVELRNPQQTRPWQSVLDALNGYLTIGRYIFDQPMKYSEGWNIGPTAEGIRSVSWIVDTIKNRYKELELTKGEQFEIKESETLGLDISKSLERLDWEPRLRCEQVVGQVVDFFKLSQQGNDNRDICMKQISDYYEGIIG